MVRDLDFQVESVGHPSVRGQDGLALSCSNSYLPAAERQTALCLSQAIGQARDIVRRSGKSTSVADLIAGATAFINAHEGCQVDYVSIVDRWTLLPSTEIDQDSVMALAVKINGRVRLIDNGLLL
jgi:pantoate--beta-alanine ligase